MKTSDETRFPLGVSFHTLDPEQRLDTIGLLGGSSVKSVELWEPTFGKDEGHVQEARRALVLTGVEPRTVHANFGSSLDISSPDAAIRSAGIRAISVALDLAVRMGARMVIVHPSSEPINDEDREARMEQSRHSIELIAAMVRDAGCRMAIELLPRTCLGRSAAELVDLLEGVDAGTAGVCLDTNHLMDGFASLPEVVRSLGPRLFSLHCSDYDGVDEKHWPPLRGVIDWAAFLSALDAAGFSGPLHYEAALDGQTPAERLAFLEANFAQVTAPACRQGRWTMRAGDAPEGRPGSLRSRNTPLTRTPAMKVEGIKGCYEKTLGMFYVARMCAKIRLHAAGKLPADYLAMLGKGFDGRTCRYLSVQYEDVKHQVLAGQSDADVLEWCFAHGRRLTDEEILIYNSFMSKRGWRDDETDEFIPAKIREYGLKDDGSALTDFDLIEMDEGRWYPDMWRAAWHEGHR